MTQLIQNSKHLGCQILVLLAVMFAAFLPFVIGDMIPVRKFTPQVYHAPNVPSLVRVNQKDKYFDSDLVASLTFDDGPNPDYTRQVLDVLDKYQVQGTFFLLGSAVETYPELVQEIVDRGHVVASHSYNHPDMLYLSEEEIRQEILGTAKLIENIIGQPTQFYRLPYGSGDARVVDAVPELTSVMWNVDSEDWVSETADQVIQNVVSQLSGDDLILFHDRLPNTVEALDRLIPEMIQAGYFFDTPDALDFNLTHF